MREIIIGANDGGQRLDRFLLKSYPLLSQGHICKFMRKNCIKLNGKKCEVSKRLTENDIIKLYIPEELLQERQREVAIEDISSELNIVYEDENILLIDKPVGLVVHEDNDNEQDTLINRILSYLYKKGEYDPEKEKSFAPALCNRIDRNTSGIVIAAKNAEALRIMSQKIKHREITKLYLCAVYGRVEPASATLTAYLYKDSSKNKVIISDRNTKVNLTIKTKYKVLSCDGENSLLEVDLLTGRTHQIRAHMAYMGHPLLGDGKYGNNRINKQYGYKYQALCSYRLKFDFTSDSGILSYLKGKEFKCALPDFALKFGYKE